jgi:hypothetical protein
MTKASIDPSEFQKLSIMSQTSQIIQEIELRALTKRERFDEELAVNPSGKFNDIFCFKPCNDCFKRKSSL